MKEQQLALSKRFGIFCAERFPLMQYGALTLLFSISGISTSFALRNGRQQDFGWHNVITTSIVVFISFYQLRVCDEHKDYVDDCRYSPERPVPRGLISRRELRSIAICLGVLQVILVASMGMAVMPYLVAIYIYGFLMAKEFFISAWLRKHPIAYLMSHMCILIFTDLFICASDFAGRGDCYNERLIWFFIASFVSGLLIELGRKIKSPDQEKPGVETYSKLFGVKTSLILLAGVMLISTIAAGITMAVLGASTLAWSYPLVCSCIAWTLLCLAYIKKSSIARTTSNLSQTVVATNYLIIAIASWLPSLAQGA